MNYYRLVLIDQFISVHRFSSISHYLLTISHYFSFPQFFTLPLPCSLQTIKPRQTTRNEADSTIWLTELNFQPLKLFVFCDISSKEFFASFFLPSLSIWLVDPQLHTHWRLLFFANNKTTPNNA